ncbi:MAG TPA: AsmA family protein, partial [Myxococcaceae bacterium]|nr:AsmA family protein [Myxococcaceae bacterium]
APLAKALPFTARALKSDEVTRLSERLPFGVRIANGVAQLSKPITWTRPDVAMRFDGGIGLDGRLDLEGRVSLGPPLIEQMTLGKVKPEQAIPVEVALTGLAWSPEVTGLDVRPAAELIAKQAAGSAARELLGEKRGKQVEGLITGGPEAAKEAARAEAERARKQAEEAAAKEKARLEEQARQEAERARKKAEEEAKKRLKGLFGR